MIRAGAEDVLASPRLPVMERLTLSGVGLRAVHVGVLAACLANPAIVHLDLSDNPQLCLGDAAAEFRLDALQMLVRTLPGGRHANLRTTTPNGPLLA